MFSTKMLGLILLLFSVRGVVLQYFNSEEGPYKTVISNVTSCASPPDWFQWNIATYTSKGHSLLRGAINSSRCDKEIKFRVIMYYLEGKKMKVFDMKNQNCHNTIVEIILKTTAIPFNEQNCRIKTGSYGFKDLDVDAIIHSVVQSLWYGAAQLRFEVRSHILTLMCLDIDFQIMKLK